MHNRLRWVKGLLKKRVIIPPLILMGSFLIWLFTPLKPLFPSDYSTIVTDRNNTLLRAYLANDEQFRFPFSDSTQLPEKYKKALIHYEDREFYTHNGINLKSLVYSFYINLKKGKRVRGGSTLTMQVARLSQKNRRTYFSKVKESLYALRIENQKSKDEILNLYATHAPMGGNIVGISAACYRYFGKPMEQITWAEASLLAVLPNAPGLIHTGRNRVRLKEKRDALLLSLLKSKEIDTLTYESALLENIPTTKKLPFFAPHFTNMVTQKENARAIHTTLDLPTQQRVEKEISYYAPTLQALGISTCAALVCKRKSGEVLAYAGSADYYDKKNQGEVDGIQAPRSPGSLIKPILTAAALDRGPFTPKTLIYDIPTYFGTYTPQNASHEYLGMVSIEDALIKSLNVPYIRLLNYYGVEDFYDLLREMGVTTLHNPYYQYGLPLILGAFETSLWELSGLYLTLANGGPKMGPHYLKSAEIESDTLLSPASCLMTTKILQNLIRPGQELYWEEFNRQIPMAWKTGTSYGRKDGWSIGYTNDFLIAVWTGNFSGRGNAAIGGAATAAPLMFSICNALTASTDTITIASEVTFRELQVCQKSGYMAGRHCPSTEKIAIPAKKSRREKLCPYHKLYQIDPQSGKSVCSLCWDIHEERSLFIVAPPARAELRRRGFLTDSIPAHKSTCRNSDDIRRMEIIYPKEGTTLLTPRNSRGEYELTLLKAAHQRSDATLFWYINGEFRGETTKGNHTFALDLPAGDHALLIEDEEGFRRQINFTSYRN